MRSTTGGIHSRCGLSKIDLTALRGDLLRLPLIGFAITLVIGLAAGVGFHAVGWVNSPLFVAIALAATSLGLVVSVLKDAGQAERPLGRYTIAGATIADFGAVILLSLFLSESEGGTASKLLTLGLFVTVIAVVALVLVRAGRSIRLDAVLIRLQDTTAEIRVRIAVALLIGFVALAAQVGLETILGAFIAGALLGVVDRDTMSHPNFRRKLDAVGYGFVIPVFFVTSGLRFDLDALTDNPSALGRVPRSSPRSSPPAVSLRGSTATRSAATAPLSPRCCRPHHCPSSSPPARSALRSPPSAPSPRPPSSPPDSCRSSSSRRSRWPCSAAESRRRRLRGRDRTRIRTRHPSPSAPQRLTF